MEGEGAQRQVRGIDVVIAALATDQQHVGGIGVHDRQPGGQARNSDGIRSANDVDGVGAVGRERGHRIVGSVSAAGVSRAGKIDKNIGDVRAGQVIYDQPVWAAERAQIDLLHVIEVHGDVGDIAREQGASSIRRNGEAFADVRAIEQHGVAAILAFDHIAAIARIPLKHVIACAEKGDIRALLPVDEVVAVAAKQQCRCRCCRGWSHCRRHRRR